MTLRNPEQQSSVDPLLNSRCVDIIDTSYMLKCPSKPTKRVARYSQLLSPLADEMEGVGYERIYLCEPSTRSAPTSTSNIRRMGYHLADNSPSILQSVANHGRSRLRRLPYGPLLLAPMSHFLIKAQ